MLHIEREVAHQADAAPAGRRNASPEVVFRKTIDSLKHMLALSARCAHEHLLFPRAQRHDWRSPRSMTPRVRRRSTSKLITPRRKLRPCPWVASFAGLLVRLVTERQMSSRDRSASTIRTFQRAGRGFQLPSYRLRVLLHAGGVACPEGRGSRGSGHTLPTQTRRPGQPRWWCFRLGNDL